MPNSTLALDDGCGCDSGSNHSKRHFRRSTLQHPQLAMIPHASSVGWNCAKKNNAWQLWKLQCLADLSKEQSELRQQYQRKSLTISYSNNAYRRRLSLQCQQQGSPTTHVMSLRLGRNKLVPRFDGPTEHALNLLWFHVEMVQPNMQHAEYVLFNTFLSKPSRSEWANLLRRKPCIHPEELSPQLVPAFNRTVLASLGL